MVVLSHLNRQRVSSQSHLSCPGAGTARWNQIKRRRRRQKKHNRIANRSLAGKAICCQMASVLFFREQKTRQLDYISSAGLCAFTAPSESNFDDTAVTEISAVVSDEGRSKTRQMTDWNNPKFNAAFLIYCLPVFLINLGYRWPRGVGIIFMIFKGMRRYSGWQIRHQCLLLETVMTDQVTIHKSGACGEGGWHWCMLGQWKMPQSDSRRQRDALNDFISVQTEISSAAKNKWFVTLLCCLHSLILYISE